MKAFKTLLYLTIPLFLLDSCSSENKKNSEQTEQTIDENKTPSTPEMKEQKPLGEVQDESQGLKVIVSETKEELQKYYEIPYIKEFYEYEKEMKYTEPRALLIPDNLSEMSYGDLRLLRNEVFARNGYLFNDGFLRGYFNKFKWYMPIFDVDTFKVVMSKDEQTLVKRIINEEAKRKAELFVDRNELELYNADLVVNTQQFKRVGDGILKDLSQNNFSIVDANRQMPFYIYDKNAYQYVPHYITTDLYLFILHKYFSRFLEKLDEKYMSVALNSILTDVVEDLNTKPEYQDLAVFEWVEAYCKTSLFALTGQRQIVPDLYKKIYELEEDRIQAESGVPVFIQSEEVNYQELKPRGHYTKSEQLKRYFKAFKWISLNGIDLDNDDELKGLMSLAFVIKSNSSIYTNYKAYTSTIEKLAGQEDNVSIRDVIAAIENFQDISELLSDANVLKVRSSLGSLNKERIKKVFGKYFVTPEREKIRVYFLSSTYSVSSEIFSKLIHIQGAQSKRPFPRGLDIAAVFKNKTAQNILVKELGDADKWPDFTDKLSSLQKQFEVFEGWDSNYGTKGLKTALSAASEQDGYPNFMKTDAYNRKELSTMLSSWTHIKHDLILYQEKPYAAEAGQGGGPEPPKHYSYVEPNIEFWNEALRLAKWLREFESKDSTFDDELQRIIDIGSNLTNAAEKQLKGEKLTDEELRYLSGIGGRIEYTLLGLLQTDHLPEREKSMALIADVYSYNGKNLNVAVGHADDIYVLVPFNNEYHIARGAVFSYYEFQDEKIYNDEQWRSKNYSGILPSRPSWIAPLINNSAPLEGQMEFRYAGHWARY
ncbi:MAG: DUF3160 domain-containing protein [Cyclobacteriaceae bacterium]